MSQHDEHYGCEYFAEIGSLSFLPLLSGLNCWQVYNQVPYNKVHSTNKFYLSNTGDMSEI